MTSVADHNVVDLCDSDDEVLKTTEIVDVERPTPTKRRRRIQAVAKAPVVSLLDDDDDDGDDEVCVVPPMTRDRPLKKQKALLLTADPTGRTNATAIEDSDLDRKPAAKARNSNLQLNQFGLNPKRLANNGYASPSKKKKLRDLLEVPPKPKTPLDSVYEVFPDVDCVYAQKLIIEQRNDIGVVLSVLADREYPKRKVFLTDFAVAASSSVIVKRTKALPKYDYLSPSSFEPSKEYILQATMELLYRFRYLSQNGVKRLMEQNKNHYSIVRQFVLNALTGKKANIKATEEEETAHYSALKKVLTSKRPNAKQLARLGQGNTRKSRSHPPIPSITDPILKDEVQHGEEQLTVWMTTFEQRLKRLQARKVSQEAGNSMECSCCFDQVAMDEMVACRDEGHLFCVDCIQSYAENQIFSSGNLGINKSTGKPALELLCCHGDGCQSPFQEVHLQKALPYKTLEKYNELQFQAAIEQAGLRQDLCTCPKCGFQADLPPTQMIFQCPMEDCQLESCRKCGKAPHIPLRCDEVTQKKRQDEGRLKVEEAISEAKIRKCPKCQTSFVKSDGCNKMSCPCGVRMCYICRGQLNKKDPYSHFCQTPHCKHTSCGKCTLYSKADEDDERAMREAGISAAQAYRNQLRKEDQAVEVQINVDQILQGPTPA